MMSRQLNQGKQEGSSPLVEYAGINLHPSALTRRRPIESFISTTAPNSRLR